jgi:hypothetical protein
MFAHERKGLSVATPPPSSSVDFSPERFVSQIMGGFNGNSIY